MTRVLTGITTTGTPHLGNYVGAIRPAIAASREPGVESFFFLADYHALIKCEDPARIARSRQEIAATWLAAGLDPERVVFYRQSDVPEIPELAWLLTCITAKGQMNRAHAYKAALDANVAAAEDPDAGITMGLYSYPILMAADILLFGAQRVPVGRDQVQHIEMARDVAARFNHLHGAGRELLMLPEAVVDEAVATLPGLDGRKMSKSYDNTVPLFEGGPEALRAAVARIVTDSRGPGEPKPTEGVALVTLFDAFATPAERAGFRAALRDGLAWGEAKARLVAQIEGQVGPMRARYAQLMARPDELEAVLQRGAAKARSQAAPLMAVLRQAVGLRAMGAAPAGPRSPDRQGPGPGALPVFKQYREADGFHVKLLAADGQSILLETAAFAEGREAGAWLKRLKAEGLGALAGVTLQVRAADGAIVEALQALAAADAARLAAG